MEVNDRKIHLIDILLNYLNTYLTTQMMKSCFFALEEKKTKMKNEQSKQSFVS